jgi:hypothetical protein
VDKLAARDDSFEPVTPRVAQVPPPAQQLGGRPVAAGNGDGHGNANPLMIAYGAGNGSSHANHNSNDSDNGNGNGNGNGSPRWAPASAPSSAVVAGALSSEQAEHVSRVCSGVGGVGSAKWRWKWA